MQHSLRLSTLPDTFAICRMRADAPVPGWASRGVFFSITRTADELSIICVEEQVPNDVKAERDWRALKVEGPLPFEVVGVISALSAPLAKAGIPIFVVSTYDTDYLLIKRQNFERACGI